MPRRQWIESMIETGEARRMELHELDRETYVHVDNLNSGWGIFNQQAPRRYDDTPISAWAHLAKEKELTDACFHF